MKEEFPGWFGSQIRQRYINKDLGVSESGELFALAFRTNTVSNLSQLLRSQRCEAHGEAFKNDQCILATQVKQVFYLEDMARRPLDWKVVQDMNHKKFLNRGVIVVEDDHDVIHFDNSSDLILFTNIIDVDEDDDLINDEDAFPHDLADSDDEDLANDDDDDVDVVYSNVVRGHDGDDRPPPLLIPTGCRGKGTRIPNRGGQKAGRLDTSRPTRNLGLRSITDKSGPVKIRFEFSDRGTLMPLGDHAAHWSNLLGEIVREFPMHYPAWGQFNLAPHMQSDHWPDIYKGIQQQLAKIYTDNKSALKKEHWVAKPDETYDVDQQPDVPRTSPRLIGMRRLDGFDLKNASCMESFATRERRCSNMPSGVPYTDDEINAQVRGGKQRGTFPVVRSDDKFSQILTQLESQPHVGSGSGSGGAGDDESGEDEDVDDHEDADGDKDSLDMLYMVCGPVKVAGENCKGMNPLGAFPGRHSPAKCRWG
ncbi:hypothetical protein Tco_0004805 [Tanacetum coccineum]